MTVKKISQMASSKKGNVKGNGKKTSKSPLTGKIPAEGSDEGGGREGKGLSREEQEIIKKKRKIFEELDDESGAKPRGRKSKDEEFPDEPVSMDEDEYFYEETSDDRGF